MCATCGRKDGDLAGVSAILDSEEGALCSCMMDEGAADCASFY